MKRRESGDIEEAEKRRESGREERAQRERMRERGVRERENDGAEGSR